MNEAAAAKGGQVSGVEADAEEIHHGNPLTLSPGECMEYISIQYAAQVLAVHFAEREKVCVNALRDHIVVVTQSSGNIESVVLKGFYVRYSKP